MQSATKQSEKLYGPTFFEEITEGSLSSAHILVPFILEHLRPTSVLDVGCAEGAWLSVFKSHGVTDCFGIDGDYVDRSRLLIDANSFSAIDLSKGFSLGRKFDLAICLEVGEHLTVDSAALLVDSLVKHTSCIAFSASIPFQDGTGHVNERWPDYWVKLFHEHGYEAVDCFRPRVWNDKRVSWWFSQNLILYYNPSWIASNASFATLLQQPSANLLPLVHPELLLHKERRVTQLIEEKRCLLDIKHNSNSIRWLSRQLVKCLLRRNS